jgi:hypothetical protein
MIRLLPSALAALLAGVTGVPAAEAQRGGPAGGPPARRPAIAFLGGPSSYDLAGTGTAGFGAVRFDLPSGRALVFEPGLTVFRYSTSAGERITYLLPELGVQVQVPGGPVRPYVGGGLGFSEFLSGRGQSDLTLHAAAGLRADVGAGWGLRGEVRVRSIDPFAGSTADFGVGLSRRLGRD